MRAVHVPGGDLRRGIALGMIAVLSLASAVPSRAAPRPSAATATGLARWGGVVATDKLTVIRDDNTPFAGMQIRGRVVRRVRIANVRLRFGNGPDQLNRYISTFDVWMDPDDGRVLKIMSPWPTGVPPIAPEPPAAFAEWQLQRSGENWSGFATSAPRVSFEQALRTVATEGYGDIIEAKQVVAVLVLTPKPTWMITLRGIPPVRWTEADRGVIPVDAVNHIRNAVDAETGKWLFASTTPQPQGPSSR